MSIEIISADRPFNGYEYSENDELIEAYKITQSGSEEYYITNDLSVIFAEVQQLPQCYEVGEKLQIEKITIKLGEYRSLGEFNGW